MVNAIFATWKRLASQRSQPRAARRTRKWAIESLEDRCLLSGAPPVVDFSALDVTVEQCEVDAGEFAQFEVVKQASKAAAKAGHVQSDPLYLSLTIVGTAIEFDSMTGLPAQLEGNIYYVSGPEAGELAGMYSEQLTPIIHPDYGFIGTTGISVFSFVDPNSHNSKPMGELTTFNQSFIVGMDPSGGILVHSMGEFTAGTGAFTKATGGFTSSSTIFLPMPGHLEIAFALNVDLTLKFEAPPRHNFLAVAGLIPDHSNQHNEHDGNRHDRHDRVSNKSSCEVTVADRSHRDVGHDDPSRNVTANDHQQQRGQAKHAVKSKRLDTKAADLVLASWSDDHFDDKTWPAAIVA